MKYLRLIIVFIGVFIFTFCTNPSDKRKVVNKMEQQPDKMDWWKDAKFGMFIHWGVYSQLAGKYKGKEIGFIGEWIMNSAKIPVTEYAGFAKQFNPVKYDPDAWVKMAKDAGMKYLVITAKHHDGFALFDSEVTDWDVVDATPYGKDLLKPLVEACRKHGLKIGFYYSQAQDWHHPGGASKKPWDTLQIGNMDKYIAEIAVPQVKELLTNYGDVDILWWDTPSKMNKERIAKFAELINPYPNLITNNRLGSDFGGDTETPEQFVPATGFPGRNWEVCMTMNDTWGYKSYDHNFKSPKELILKLSDIVSKGGNFLLNVGPDALGQFPPESVEILKKIGKWMETNHEAIYGTQASPFHHLKWGKATVKGDKLYLHVIDWPEDGMLKLPLKNRVEKAYLLADSNTKVGVTKFDNYIELKVPKQAPDSIVSIVVLEYEGIPNVLPIPSYGKTGIASSTDTSTTVTNLFDGDPKNKWTPEKGVKTASVEIDLGEEVKIGNTTLAEPWHPWHKNFQKFELQVKRGGKWEKVVSGETGGYGYSLDFEPITGRYFRLTITGPKDKEPELNEWILFRAV
jgi:alpha-L-fucosidase